MHLTGCGVFGGLGGFLKNSGRGNCIPFSPAAWSFCEPLFSLPLSVAGCHDLYLHSAQDHPMLLPLHVVPLSAAAVSPATPLWGCPVPLQLLPSFHRPSPAHGHPLLPLLSSAPLDRFYRCCFFNHGLSAPPPCCTRSNRISTC